MKRNEIVGKLIKEGFSEKTLVRFTDKQLVDLHERILGENLTATLADISKSPALQAAAKDPKQSIRVVGEEGEVSEELKGGQKKLDKNHNGKIDGQDFKILKGQKKEMSEEKPSAGLSKEKKSEVVKKAKKGGDIGKKGKGFEKLADKAAKEYGSKEKGEKVAAASMWKNIQREGEEIKEWVEKLGENYYHSLTSKNEIMELIQTKLNESETVVPMPAKAKKGHNDVMEFMTYDAAEPTTKPKEPTTKPGTKEPPKTRPSHPGKNPNPGVNPGPKAIKPEEAKDKVIKVIKGILGK